PSALRSLGEEAFSGCCSLQFINLPDSLESIGPHAFRDCPLDRVPWKKAGLTYWRNRLLYADPGVVQANVQAGVTSIGDNAFEGCQALVSVTLPDSVTEIGKEAFMCCESLVSVTMPNSVLTIGEYSPAEGLRFT
ncbi:leucine-rich repeat domain-containing protein, partial [bacterium]|nr:leucine-rich repeat domain-containing protein [bacterium]